LLQAGANGRMQRPHHLGVAAAIELHLQNKNGSELMLDSLCFCPYAKWPLCFRKLNPKHDFLDMITC
jgi:hypothetical protein